MAAQQWYRLDVRTSPAASDLVTQFVVELGSKGSMVAPEGEWSVVSGFLPFDGRGDHWLAEAAQRLDRAKQYGLCRSDSSVSLVIIDDEDWAENWKQYFKPIDVGTKFCIVPPWLAGTEEDRGSRMDDRNDSTPLPSSILNHRSSIIIEPGMAFGTGQHATTVLCLELLEVTVHPGDCVLDVGTGSGILAIGAALLGARRVIALDSDPLCPPAVAKNAAANGVANRVLIVQGDLLACLQVRVNVVVANLTSFGIQLLVAQVPRCLVPGGWFLASGIPVEKSDEVTNTITAAGFRVVELRAREGWVAFATCTDSD